MMSVNTKGKDIRVAMTGQYGIHTIYYRILVVITLEKGVHYNYSSGE